MNTEGTFNILNKKWKDRKLIFFGMCKTRWKGNTFEKYKIINFGYEKHQKGLAIIMYLGKMKGEKYWAALERIFVKLSSRPFDVNIIHANTPTAEGSENSIDVFCSDIENALKMCSNSDINIMLSIIR